MATIFTEKVRHPSTNNWISLWQLDESTTTPTIYDLKYYNNGGAKSLNLMLTTDQDIIPDLSNIRKIGDNTHRYTNLYLTGTVDIGGENIQDLVYVGDDQDEVPSLAKIWINPSE